MGRRHQSITPTHAKMSETMRVSVDHGEGKMACLHLPRDATVADVMAALEKDPAVRVPKPELVRMIGNGSELEGTYKLESLGEFFFMRNAIYLREVDVHACREWQRTGRCTNRNCPHKATLRWRRHIRNNSVSGW